MQTFICDSKGSIADPRGVFNRNLDVNKVVLPLRPCLLRACEFVPFFSRGRETVIGQNGTCCIFCELFIPNGEQCARGFFFPYLIWLTYLVTRGSSLHHFFMACWRATTLMFSIQPLFTARWSVMSCRGPYFIMWWRFSNDSTTCLQLPLG